MKKIAVLVAMMMVFATGAMAEGKRPFTGLYTSVGTHKSDGEFSLSHRGNKFSFGKILAVPMSGDLTTYELGYRFPIAQSNLRLSINAVLHDGVIRGAKQWPDHKSSATFWVASDLRVSAGGELGLVLGKRERLYVYAGAGVVATNLAMGISIETPYGDWNKEKEGGALGALYTIGVQYQATDRLSIGFEASKMKFNADKAFGLGSMGSHTLEAEFKKTTFGLVVSYNF